MKVQIAASTVLVALGACAAPQFTLRQANYGQMAPEGETSIVTSSASLLPGSAATTSFSDVGIDEEADTLGLRADLKFGSPHLTLSTQNSSWDGSGAVSADFGEIPASTAVDSTIDLAFHRLSLTFDVVPTDYLELGLGFGATVADVSATVEATGLEPESIDEIIPIPVLAGRLGGRVWIFDAEALVSGLSADVDGNQATFLEWDANLKWAFLGSHGGLSGSLVGGWRSIAFEVDYEDDDTGDAVTADWTFDGPYLQLQLGI